MLKVGGATVIGGGFVGIGARKTALHILDKYLGAPGRSANLVLFRDREDASYGRWVVCEVDIADPSDRQKLVGKFGITERTVFPFGFEVGSDFCNQIARANEGMNIFTYSFNNNVAGFFSELIKDAIEGSN